MSKRSHRRTKCHPRRRLGTAPPAIAIGLTAALLVPSFAAAERVEVPDRRGDYWHDVRSAGDDPYHGHPDSGNPDIRRTAYRHWHHRVSVRIKMAENPGYGYWQVEIRMRTNERLRRKVTWFKPTQGAPSTTWSGPGTCAIEGRIDTDAFIVDIPRRCLSFPDRVAFKSATRLWPTSDDFPYVDVSGSRGYRLRTWSAPVRRG